MSDPVEKIRNAEAWSEFCELLKKAGEVILREDLETSDFDRGEGHRYLSRLLRAGLHSFAEGTGPVHAEFRPMPPLVKMGLDNPDNFYVSASVDPRYDYRIRGKRGTIHYLSFAAQSQNFAARDKIAGGAGHLEDSELRLESDGSFEIVASRNEQPGNWLRMADHTSQILIRQTFLDRNAERPVEVGIECLTPHDPPPPLDPARVPGQLLGSALYAIGCAQWFADWVVEFGRRSPVNQFHLPDEEEHRSVGGDPNVRMWLGQWKLAPDEVLVVEATPPRCDYWNFQIANIWGESLDFVNRRVHTNSHTAVYEADGSFRIVVASEDPGLPNWIDTAGHDHGIMGLRWVRSSEHPEPRSSVVRRDELPAFLTRS
jgi:hypothetical protein